jgi:two-component system, chemotaxis family, protein-glutamate methylesterase/glutaminase
MIKILVVEDSSVVAELLTSIFNSDPKLRVIARARNGAEAVNAVAHYKPDVVTMDINMPIMNGFEATRSIMETNPTPIIIISDIFTEGDIATTFRAIESGALMAVSKPAGIGHPKHEEDARALVQAVILMSEIKVVKRWPKSEKLSHPADTFLTLPRVPAANVGLVAIGASTGGPPVLKTILSALPANFSTPLIVVQHMAAGFIRGFAEWLAQYCRLPVHVASNGEVALSGHVYIAPDGAQIRIDAGGRIILVGDCGEHDFCPSVSVCFHSVAENYGKKAVGILLTGMGKDGAQELKLMKKAGAITIAQDEISSIVFGMPGEAIKIGAAQYVFNPQQISEFLKGLVYKKQ